LPLWINTGTDLTLDSVSTSGTRIEGLGSITVDYNPVSWEFLFEFDAAPGTPIPAGSGVMVNLYFTISQNASSQDVVIDTTFIPPDKFFYLEDDTGSPVDAGFNSGLIHIKTTRPIIHLEPEEFFFSTYQGIDPEGQILNITNLGEDPLHWAFQLIPIWLRVSETSGTAPSAVTLTPEVMSMPIGVYYDSVSVHDEVAIPKHKWAYITLEITTAPGLAGIVQEPDADLIPDATVEIWDEFPGGSLLYSTITDVNGEFEFLGVPENDYQLYAYKVGYYPTTQPVSSPDDDIVVILEPTAVIDTVCIDLHTGWNLISWNVDTEFDETEIIIDGIEDCIDVILGFESGAATYDPDLPHLSTLKFMDHLHGYWFRMDCDAELCVSGVQADPSTPIYLEKNWNLVSYLPSDSDSLVDALISMYDELIVALGYDMGGQTHDPQHPGAATLNIMHPEFGFWLKTANAVTLVYPWRGIALSDAYPAEYGSEKIGSSAVTPTREWISLFGEGVTIDGVLIPSGTALQMYDQEGNVCGEMTIVSDGIVPFTPVYRDDESTPVDEGMRAGEKIHISVDGAGIAENYSWSSFGSRVRLGLLTSLDKGSTVLPTEYELAQNFPNPFNPETTISFSIPKKTNVKLEIISILGATLHTLVNETLPAGRHTVSWKGKLSDNSPAPSGVYFYRLTTEDFSSTKKMILLK